jgi:putative transposase
MNRTHLGDGIFHVTARGNRRQDTFVVERDYVSYLVLLAGVVKRFGWTCLAFCLMPNHVHLVIESENLALSRGMHRLQGAYAQWFNGVHRVDGHLFQDRFHAKVVGREQHWTEVIRYVVLNPVRAGICEQPEEWTWSSFNATAGTAPVPAFLAADRVLSEFSKDERAAQRAYVAFVREGIGACPGTGPAVRPPSPPRRPAPVS